MAIDREDFADLIDELREIKFAIKEKSGAMSVYNPALEIFETRLRMKHLLKGATHRSDSPRDLFGVLLKELNELDDEIKKKHETRTIEEALDVMICGLLIADRIMAGGAYK